MANRKISGRDIRRALRILQADYKADGAHVAAAAVETSSSLLDDEMYRRLASILTDTTKPSVRKTGYRKT